MRALKAEIDSLIKNDLHKYTFGEAISQCRYRCGISISRVSDFVHIFPSRLKRIEEDRFRTSLDKHEFDSLCDFYELPVNTMREKMERQLEKFKKVTKASKFFNDK